MRVLQYINPCLQSHRNFAQCLYLSSLWLWWYNGDTVFKQLFAGKTANTPKIKPSTIAFRLMKAGNVTEVTLSILAMRVHYGTCHSPALLAANLLQGAVLTMPSAFPALGSCHRRALGWWTGRASPGRASGSTVPLEQGWCPEPLCLGALITLRQGSWYPGRPC